MFLCSNRSRSGQKTEKENSNEEQTTPSVGRDLFHRFKKRDTSGMMKNVSPAKTVYLSLLKKGEKK